MRDERPIGDDDLDDYVDGRLSEARRAEVEAYLQRDREAAAKVKRLQAINAALRGIASDILDEPPPDRLLRALRRRRTLQ